MSSSVGSHMVEGQIRAIKLAWAFLRWVPFLSQGWGSDNLIAWQNYLLFIPLQWLSVQGSLSQYEFLGNVNIQAMVVALEKMSMEGIGALDRKPWEGPVVDSTLSVGLELLGCMQWHLTSWLLRGCSLCLRCIHLGPAWHWGCLDFRTSVEMHHRK